MTHETSLFKKVKNMKKMIFFIFIKTRLQKKIRQNKIRQTKETKKKYQYKRLNIYKWELLFIQID